MISLPVVGRLDRHLRSSSSPSSFIVSQTRGQSPIPAPISLKVAVLSYISTSTSAPLFASEIAKQRPAIPPPLTIERQRWERLR